MNRVEAVILHPGPAPGVGPLTDLFASLRRQNAERQAEGFRRAGARSTILDDLVDDTTFGERLRNIAGALGRGGLIVLGSGSIPLATAADRRAFVATAGGPPGHALANNRFSADVVAVADAARLADVPDLPADNGLPRWLAGIAGFTVTDLRARWRLQVDLDSLLDALLIRSAGVDEAFPTVGVPTIALQTALGGVQAATRDARRELVVTGRVSADGLRWLERSTASRTRVLSEERGFRTRTDRQRPVRSSLGLLLDRDGPGALGTLLSELGDAALVDSRVLLAHHFGADERGWPIAEDRLASDLLLPERIADPWLRALTRGALDAPIPVVLGGHTLVGPGLRLALAEGRRWT